MKLNWLSGVLLLLFALLLSNTSDIAAQTPGAWIPVGEFKPDYLGAIRGAHTHFSHLDGDRGSLQFVAMEFENSRVAAAAMAPIADNVLDNLSLIYETDITLHETSSRTLGDEMIVLAGSFSPGRFPDKLYDEAIVVVRSDRFVWLGTGFRRDEFTPLTDVLDVLERVVGREPQGEAVLVDDHWEGGAFGMLPTLADLPEGYAGNIFVQAAATPVA